jgi:hypothetical protein
VEAGQHEPERGASEHGDLDPFRAWCVPQRQQAGLGGNEAQGCAGPITQRVAWARRIVPGQPGSRRYRG